ncbi:MAG: hypothetical protein KA140_00065 [Caldisericia bacterium]|nr:hypothetical protein [Caldisericia bacterium]
MNKIAASHHQTLDLIGQISYSIESGVSPLKRFIMLEVENRLADLILSGKLVSGDCVSLDEKDGQLAVLKG